MWAYEYAINIYSKTIIITLVVDLNTFDMKQSRVTQVFPSDTN